MDRVYIYNKDINIDLSSIENIDYKELNAVINVEPGVNPGSIIYVYSETIDLQYDEDIGLLSLKVPINLSNGTAVNQLTVMDMMSFVTDVQLVNQDFVDDMFIAGDNFSTIDHGEYITNSVTFYNQLDEGEFVMTNDNVFIETTNDDYEILSIAGRYHIDVIVKILKSKLVGEDSFTDIKMTLDNGRQISTTISNEQVASDDEVVTYIRTNNAEEETVLLDYVYDDVTISNQTPNVFITRSDSGYCNLVIKPNVSLSGRVISVYITDTYGGLHEVKVMTDQGVMIKSMTTHVDEIVFDIKRSEDTTVLLSNLKLYQGDKIYKCKFDTSGSYVVKGNEYLVHGRLPKTPNPGDSVRVTIQVGTEIKTVQFKI